jgi:phosphomannomutase
LVAGLVVTTGYALVQPLQTPQQVTTTSTVNIETRVQATEQSAQQTAERILVLNISMDGVEFSSDSTIHLKVTVRNTGTDPKVRVITATLQTALSEKTAILIHDIMELV